MDCRPDTYAVGRGGHSSSAAPAGSGPERAGDIEAVSCAVSGTLDINVATRVEFVLGDFVARPDDSGTSHVNSARDDRVA